MPRLTHPTAGTVVSLEGDLEARYRAAGWTDAESVKQDEAPSEKPAPKRRGRQPKTT